MQLKVGELARSTGLTVRTLHHYDEIGLLKPSGRSESGYRLYSTADIARLHGIQALRQLGLALHDIAALLDDAHAAPQMILAQQLHALERQIAQATELRDRLALIQDGLEAGKPPESEHWLEALALMSTYGKYFSTAELKKIFGSWHKIETAWPKLLAEVRAVMETGAAPESAATQRLARRWMALVHHWMDGDFELMRRWGEMYQSEPSAHGRRGGPPTDMMLYMQRATNHRMALLGRHFTLQELAKFRYVPEEEWQAVNDAGAQLLRAGAGPVAAPVRTLARQYLGLLQRLTGDDPALLRKSVAVTSNEPLLQSGSPLDAQVRGLLLQALEGLDPHAT